MSALFGLTSTGKNLSPMNPLAELVLVDSGSMEIDASLVQIAKGSAPLRPPTAMLRSRSGALSETPV